MDGWIFKPWDYYGFTGFFLGNSGITGDKEKSIDDEDDDETKTDLDFEGNSHDAELDFIAKEKELKEELLGRFSRK